MLKSYKPLNKLGIIILFYCSFYATQCQSSHAIQMVNPDLCKINQYFDSTKLDCVSCGLDDESQKQYQQRSEDGLSCICKAQHRLIKIQGTNIKCQPCGLDEVVSFDGYHCINCSNENPFQNTTGTCLTCENGIVVEEIAEHGIIQECKQCRNSTVPNNSGTRCLNCPEGFIFTLNSSCACPNDSFVKTGDACVPSNALPLNSDWATITFLNGQEVKSAYYLEHFQAALYNCKVQKNYTACQVLANLCVLTLYKSTKEQNDYSACNQYLRMTESQNGRPTEWPAGSPWLYYLNEDSKAELFKTNVPNRFSVKSGTNTSQLNLIAATYSLNGTFLGWIPLSGDTISPCIPVDQIESVFAFGVQFNRNCKVNIRKMWDNAVLKFFDLYIAHYNNEHETLYPVPVLIKNLQKNGILLNKGSDQSKWQLVRRFFLFDPVSGVENSNDAEMSKFLRYADDISIMVTVSEDEDRVGAIFPPLLIINYAEVTMQDYLYNAKVSVYFAIEYKMEQTKTFFNILVSLAVLSALSLFWTFFQTWSWSRRSGKRNIDVLTLWRFIVLTSGTLSNVFLLVVLCASLNWLIIYKKQSVVHLLLPTPGQEDSIMVYISVAFAMKCIDLLDILVTQCTANVFFIDWERPKIKINTTARRSSTKTMEETFGGPESSTNLGSSSGMGSALTRTNAERQNEIAGASIWRTYFVANNWAELQTIRRVKPSMQLFCSLLFLNVFGFENLATADPHSNFSKESNHLETPYSTTCRFAIGATVYLVIAFVQFAVHRVIYERFFEDKLQQFVDLCSVSNISVFIMSLSHYGYYVHGRSTHGRADVNMKEMHEHLRREEEDLCSQRGLLPNTEQQTFQITLPDGVNEHYKRLLLPLTAYSQTADRMQGSGGHLTRVDIDRVVSTYLMMNKFLSGFIEHAFKDLDYTVKDKLLMENILDVEFTDVNDRGYFYNDSGHSFDRVLFCGQETTLILFEALLFVVIDAGAKDFVLAAVLTYLVARVIEAIRHCAGRRNLVRKALIDERFLC